MRTTGSIQRDLGLKEERLESFGHEPRHFPFRNSTTKNIPTQRAWVSFKIRLIRVGLGRYGELNNMELMIGDHLSISMSSQPHSAFQLGVNITSRERFRVMRKHMQNNGKPQPDVYAFIVRWYALVAVLKLLLGVRTSCLPAIVNFPGVELLCSLCPPGDPKPLSLYRTVWIPYGHLVPNLCWEKLGKTFRWLESNCVALRTKLDRGHTTHTIRRPRPTVPRRTGHIFNHSSTNIAQNMAKGKTSIPSRGPAIRVCYYRHTSPGIHPPYIPVVNSIFASFPALSRGFTLFPSTDVLLLLLLLLSVFPSATSQEVRTPIWELDLGNKIEFADCYREARSGILFHRQQYLWNYT